MEAAWERIQVLAIFAFLPFLSIFETSSILLQIFTLVLGNNQLKVASKNTALSDTSISHHRLAKSQNLARCCQIIVPTC